MDRVRLGNEALFQDRLDLVQGKRVGLITNPSGVDASLVLTADRLVEADGVVLGALFGPEHGVWGEMPEGAAVSSFPEREIPVYSLYGDTRRPTEAMLAPLDVILFDLQDVGARFYTFISTLGYALEACAAGGVPCVVLDRPNPIGGEALEGNLSDPAFRSFVGAYPILLRHGMTVGELAGFLNGEFNLGADLSVVRMAGWQRCMGFSETGLFWVPPSPNMPTPETAWVYPGTCLVEGTHVSEGRGTARPFEQVGAPFIASPELAAALNDRELPGVRFRATTFVPVAGKFRGERCGGVQLHLTDSKRFEAVRTGLEVIVTIRTLYPHGFAWRTPSSGRVYPFDRLMGTDAVRKAIEGGASVGEIVDGWEGEIKGFGERRRAYLLY